jgi:hypothetical protein
MHIPHVRVRAQFKERLQGKPEKLIPMEQLIEDGSRARFNLKNANENDK